MSNGAAAAAAAAAAIANAIKASGGLVVRAPAGFFGTSFKYLLNYKGFAFYTKTPAEIPLPAGVELVLSQKIWIPG